MKHVQSKSKSSEALQRLLNLKQVKIIVIYWIFGLNKKCLYIKVWGKLWCDLFPWKLRIILLLISHKHESKTVIRPSTHRLANKIYYKQYINHTQFWKIYILQIRIMFLCLSAMFCSKKILCLIIIYLFFYLFQFVVGILMNIKH